VNGRLLPIACTVAAFAVWELLVRVLHIPAFLLPAPSAVLEKLYTQRGMFLMQTWPTVTSIFIGFVLAVGVGIPIATMMVYSKNISNAIYPLLLTAQILPKVALAPLFIVWFGFGLLPKVAMTFLIAFFPIIIDTVIGLQSVRPESLMLIRSMGGTRWQAFWRVRLPCALPSIFGGLRVAITLAVVGTIVAEFVGSDSGLGYVLVLARGNLDIVTVFAAIVWLVVIGFIFYFAVDFAERYFVRGVNHNRGLELGGGL
jgi:NitT/TauT family transport system permease protein